MPTMDGALPPVLEERREQLIALCQHYGVERLELFGSAGTERFDPGRSDLDFIVRMSGQRQAGYAGRFCTFADRLEQLLNRRVDLLTEAMIRSSHFQHEVNQSRRMVLEL